jgi:hypothetical protein
MQLQTSHTGIDVQRRILKVYVEIQIKVCPETDEIEHPCPGNSRIYTSGFWVFD